MSESDSDSDLQELVACPGLYQEITVGKHHVNNKSALTNALNHVSNKLPWIERLDILTSPAPAPKELDVVDDPNKINPDDDFKRENYFYRLAQAAVLKAIPQLHTLGVPTKRPVDYFAEMIKTDEHMDKVKQHLVETEQRLALRERARQMREKRKFGKQTQMAVLQNRRAEKRKLTEAIKASRKKSGKNQEAVLDEILKEYQTGEDRNNTQKNKPEKGGYHRAKDIANRRKYNHRRDYKNKKFGHGGQKKRGKRNTTDSFASGFRRDFNPLVNQGTPQKAKKMRLEARSAKTGKSKFKKSGPMKQKRH
ncbi:unnamed protein product [Calicophoron daubneyi]|uniref:rRNA-processing protein EBP2 n=1 Tax=Calicophoron daubneyi TaxID=300641 RepID=A0AAV2TTQ0_CALDB